MNPARHTIAVEPDAPDVSHVFAAAEGVGGLAVRLAGVIDPAFPVEVGWDAACLVLSPPPEHPLLGRPVCRADRCSTTA